MDPCIRVLGRRFESQDLEWLRHWIAQREGWSRRRLSVALAQHWDWRNPRGQLRDMATRLLLKRLEVQGLLWLPARQNRGGRRRIASPTLAGAVAGEPIEASLDQLQPLHLELLQPGHGLRPQLAADLAQHHYLSYPHPLGQLHYRVADRQGRSVAGLLFGPAAWKCAPRDRWIGWTAAQRTAGLGHIANNSRFMILPWVKVPHLASHLLSLVLRRLAADWLNQTGQKALLVETFVEVERFAATSYRASNWIDLGLTQGRSRQGRSGHRVPVKRILVRPLVGPFHDALCR
jgi:hypothetical protein